MKLLFNTTEPDAAASIGRTPFHDNYAMYDTDDLEFLERRRLWATGCQHPDDCQPDYCGCDSMPIDPDL